MNLSASIREFLDALVHPSARADRAAAERHLAFMMSRLFGSLIALGVFPVFLAVHGVPSMLEFAVLAWMLVPISIAFFLSRTGRYDAAQALSAFALTGIVTIVAGCSGGIGSVAAIWLVLIPLEAALSGSRRAVVVAALFATCGAGLLVVAGSWLDIASGGERVNGPLAGLGLFSTLLYATGIAVGALSNREAGNHDLRAPCASDVVTRHGHGGRVTCVSANAQAVLGAAASELLGYGLFDLIHISDRPAYLHALSETAVSGDPGEVEFRLRRPGQAEFTWIEMRCESSAAYASRGPEVVAVLRDITLRKTRQNVLIAARAEAERANAAKSRFMALMSHELRTPLNAVIGLSDRLRQESEVPIDSTLRLEYARIINELGSQLLAVVNEILDMSQLDTGDFEIIPELLRLDDLIASCHESLALRAQEFGVTLKVDVPAALPEMIADRRAITRILFNLIANAIKFGGRGGTVAVSAGEDGQHISLEVANVGTGIPSDEPEGLTCLGNPSSRVWGTYGPGHDGVGLGLSIVKGLVNLHGGEIIVRNAPGEGVHVVVRLPRDCEGAAGLRCPVPMANGTSGGMRKRSRRGSWTSDPAETAQPQSAMNSLEDLLLPVQRRA